MNDIQSMRGIVTKAELEGLLAGKPADVAQESAASAATDPDITEDSGRRLIEQSFHYWEQTVHDLMREVKELKSRIEQLERMHEDPQPVELTLPEAPAPAETQEPRPSRVERHRKSRWF